jgi:hypothetical protein
MNNVPKKEGNLIYVQQNNVKQSSFFDLFSSQFWSTTLLLWIIWFTVAYGNFLKII